MGRQALDGEVELPIGQCAMLRSVDTEHGLLKTEGEGREDKEENGREACKTRG